MLACWPCFAILIVQLAKLHWYVGATDMVGLICWWNCASGANRQRNTNILQILRFCRFFFMSAALLHWFKLIRCTNILTHYKENLTVISTLPDWLNITYSIGWSGAETETHVSRLRLISETKIHWSPQCELRTPLISHWSLPFSWKQLRPIKQ